MWIIIFWITKISYMTKSYYWFIIKTSIFYIILILFGLQKNSKTMNFVLIIISEYITKIGP